jgi:hypothetical protein
VALVQTGGPRGEDVAVLLLPAQLPVSVDGDAPTPLAQVHAEGGSDLLLRTVVDYTEIDVDHVVTGSVDALPRAGRRARARGGLRAHLPRGDG